MKPAAFIEYLRKAFGQKADLPIAVWYSDEPLSATEKAGGCIFKHLDAIDRGATVSLDGDNTGCGGGKFYCGFSDMPPHVPAFVSEKEHYKASPELVLDIIRRTDVRRSPRRYLNLARIDMLDSFESIEGIVFIASPDIISGLVTWACYDRNEPDTVCALFGSGCANTVTQLANENRRGGYRCFLGMFDPSARIHIAADRLSLAIPMSRLGTMLKTMPQCCLFDTHAWSKIRDRLDR